MWLTTDASESSKCENGYLVLLKVVPTMQVHNFLYFISAKYSLITTISINTQINT